MNENVYPFLHPGRGEMFIELSEQRSPELVEPYAGKLKRNKAAWDFFQAQPPSYRKMMNWFIVSAKLEETRTKRLDRLIDASAKGIRL